MTNVDTAELGKFNRLADQWWDPNGEFKTLHDINPLRLEYILQRSGIIKGKQVLDVGCGGGLLAGIAAWVKRRRPACRIIGVEPAAADAMARSIEAGSPVTIEPRPTIADGLMPIRPGDLTFEHARALVDEIVRVDEAAIEEAMMALPRQSKLVVEPSGAATTAALLSGQVDVRGARVAVVASGVVALFGRDPTREATGTLSP